MELSLCIRCGAKKRAPWRKCKSCGHDPSKERGDLVKSVYLSTGRFEDEDDQADYVHELNRIADRLKLGIEPAYDAEELDRLSMQKKMVDEVGIRQIVGLLFRTFLPGIIIVGVIALIVIILKHVIDPLFRR